MVCHGKELGRGPSAARSQVVVIPFWGSTKSKTRTGHAASSTVLRERKEPVKADLSILEKFLEGQKERKFCREHARLRRDPQSCFNYDQYEMLV